MHDFHRDKCPGAASSTTMTSWSGCSAIHRKVLHTVTATSRPPPAPPSTRRSPQRPPPQYPTSCATWRGLSVSSSAISCQRDVPGFDNRCVSATATPRSTRPAPRSPPRRKRPPRTRWPARAEAERDWRQNTNHWRAATRPGSDAQVVMLRLPKIPQFAAGKHTAPGSLHRGP